MRTKVLIAFAVWYVAALVFVGAEIMAGWRSTCDRMRQRYDVAWCEGVPNPVPGCTLWWDADGDRHVWREG